MSKKEKDKVGKIIKMEGLKQLPMTAISFGLMDWNETGNWRYLRPLYRVKTAPCILECPIGEIIPRYMHKLAQGAQEEAWKILVKDNPLPAACGRLCNHPCEVGCLRRDFDETVGVRDVERFLGDTAIGNWALKPPKVVKSERVAVVGAGPSGLSCAFHLAQSGYKVTMFDEGDAPGGSLRRTVPEFILPSRILDGEIANILSMGIEFKGGTRLSGPGMLEELMKEYEVMFLSTGFPEDGIGDSFEIDSLSGIRSFCGEDIIGWSRKRGKHDELGRKVAVVGTGMTALHVTRCARRYASEVHLFLNGDMDDLQEEVQTYEDKGITIHEEVNLKGIKGSDRSIVIDYSSRGKGGGSLDFDSLVLTGTGRTDPLPLKGFVDLVDDRVVVNEVCQTSKESVFAGGSVVTGGDMNIAEAIGWGSRGARAIDAFFKGRLEGRVKKEKKVVTYENLNLDYFKKEERNKPAVRDFEEGTLEEPVQTFDENTAMAEAARCFECGICIFCDNCLIFCPDVAIDKIGKGYKIDYYHCKGCGICVNECPRDAMSMESELKWKK
jgi:2-oxoacid:acceptor oxidoreductase delta subunit (pyruvate/2-ketoisovalerate family)